MPERLPTFVGGIMKYDIKREEGHVCVRHCYKKKEV